jgi:large subunit ribosomal protein L16
MLQPKQTKYRKQFKGRNRGVATRGTEVCFGQFGLKATTSGLITARQIEAGRRVLVRRIKRGGSNIWIRVFPDKPVTKKPAEVRQGKGKGNVEYWGFPVERGRVIFEMAGVSSKTAEEALLLAGDKLPFKTRFVKRTIM